MKRLESVPLERVVDAFRDDQKVRQTGRPWPETFAEKVELLREAHRPVDQMRQYRWTLYELSREEFLSLVRTVWGRDPSMFYSWSLEEMCAAHRAGTFPLPEPNSVAALEASMRANARPDLGVLVGYRDNPEFIGLEEGHNRATAAVLAGAVPAAVRMYVGEP